MISVFLRVFLINYAGLSEVPAILQVTQGLRFFQRLILGFMYWVAVLIGTSIVLLIFSYFNIQFDNPILKQLDIFSIFSIVIFTIRVHYFFDTDTTFNYNRSSAKIFNRFFETFIPVVFPLLLGPSAINEMYKTYLLVIAEYKTCLLDNARASSLVTMFLGSLLIVFLGVISQAIFLILITYVPSSANPTVFTLKIINYISFFWWLSGF